ncbi:MAG: hypothetical protein IJ432_06850, partial [Clostridia bacterium]|nr:hypothetical protein [Clostridia bacterium]
APLSRGLQCLSDFGQSRPEAVPKILTVFQIPSPNLSFRYFTFFSPKSKALRQNIQNFFPL